MDRTCSTSTAYSIAAATESSPLLPGFGTRLPTLRTTNRSPGPLEVIIDVTSRESAQVEEQLRRPLPFPRQPYQLTPHQGRGVALECADSTRQLMPAPPAEAIAPGGSGGTGRTCRARTPPAACPSGRSSADGRAADRRRVRSGGCAMASRGGSGSGRGPRARRSGCRIARSTRPCHLARHAARSASPAGTRCWCGP